MQPRYEVVKSVRYVHKPTANTPNRRTASIYGAVPWRSDAEAADWETQHVGWTIRDNLEGTVGMGRAPWATRDEAQAAADKWNGGAR